MDILSEAGVDSVHRTYDLHYLSMQDSRSVDKKILDDEAALMEYTRENCILLCEEFIKLPKEQTEVGLASILPTIPKEYLPREKPVPIIKGPTVWSEFAKAQNIKHRKKSKLVYDEKTGEYRNRYGFNRHTNNTVEKDIIVPAKKGVDDFEGAIDPFTRAKKERRERIAKNKASQMKNQAREEKRIKDNKKLKHH